jgi:amino acid transporter
MLAVNLAGAKFAAKAQSVIVAVVLASVAVFIVVTLANMNTDLLAPSGHPSFSKIVASVALTFFAYLGFNVITSTAGPHPARDGARRRGPRLLRRGHLPGRPRHVRRDHRAGRASGPP